MKADFDYNTVPYGFSHCFNAKCPRAKKCVRYLVTQYLLPTHLDISIINPARITDGGKGCIFFMADKVVTFASGTKHLLDNIPHKDALAIRLQLIRHFGQNNYYRFRSGKRLISPSEQKLIQRIFINTRISTTPVYDEYIEQYDWK